MENNTVTAQRSEFLFVYDTRMANPNGDPDENRPRIDPYSGKNLVTEYRLKRTIRDYIEDHFNGSDDSTNKIFIREELNIDNTRKPIEDLAGGYMITVPKKDKKGKETKVETVDKDRLIREHIDIRLFGLMFLVKGNHFKTLGPVQFSIGQSLNKVQEILVRNVRVVPTKKDAKSGTFGEKSILKYSLIVFHGFLNQIAARQDSKLSEKDIQNMMLAMWHGTNNLSTSSKYGQVSRFLLRIIYSDENAYIGDIDRELCLANADVENIEDISHADIEVSKLFATLTDNKIKIKEIEFACHHRLDVRLNNGKESLKDALENWAKDEGVPIRNILSS
jgi:CRISPR-associated protein Csh2